MTWKTLAIRLLSVGSSCLLAMLGAIRARILLNEVKRNPEIFTKYKIEEQAKRTILVKVAYGPMLQFVNVFVSVFSQFVRWRPFCAERIFVTSWQILS